MITTIYDLEALYLLAALIVLARLAAYQISRRIVYRLAYARLAGFTWRHYLNM
jgi:hypothetical protein